MAFTFTIQDFNQFGPVVPLPQEGIYENDFTKDPVGDFSFANSDYIDSELTGTILTTSPYVTGTITANGLESASQSAFTFAVLGTSPETVTGTFLILETDSEILFSLRTNSTLDSYMGFKVISSDTGVYVQSIAPDGSLFNDQIVDVPDTNWTGKTFSFYMNLTSDRIFIRIYLNGNQIYNRTSLLTINYGTIFFCAINNKVTLKTLYVDGDVESPATYLFKNNYLTDPLGLYDFENSDYKNSNLTFVVLDDDEDHRGQIFSRGLQNQVGKFMSQFIGKISPIDNPKVAVDFRITSPYTTGASKDSMSISINVSLTGQGMTTQVYVTEDEDLFFGTPTSGNILIAKAPASNWLDKKLTAKLTTTDGQNGVLTGYVDDVEADNITIDYGEVHNGTYTLIFMQAETAIQNSIAIENMSINGAIYVPEPPIVINLIDSLEHDVINGTNNSIVQIDSSHYILAYAGSNNRGYIKTFEIDSSYNISELDSLLHDSAQGIYNSLVKIDDTHYILAYSGESGDGYIKTFSIDGSYNITQIDVFEHDSTVSQYNSFVQIDATHYILAYSADGTDGHIKTIRIDGSYNITQIDVFEHDTNASIYNSLVKIDSTHYILAYSGGDIKTFFIDGSYNITQLQELNHDTTSNYNSLTQIDSTHYILAYTGADNDGYVKTFSIDGSYNITELNSFEHDIYNGTHNSLIYARTANYILAYAGRNDDGFIKALEIDDSYNITEANVLEHDEINGEYNSLVMIDSTHCMLAYSGDGDDGYIKTFNLGSSIVYYWRNFNIEGEDPSFDKLDAGYNDAVFVDSGQNLRLPSDVSGNCILLYSFDAVIGDIYNIKTTIDPVGSGGTPMLELLEGATQLGVDAGNKTDYEIVASTACTQTRLTVKMTAGKVQQFWKLTNFELYKVN